MAECMPVGSSHELLHPSFQECKVDKSTEALAVAYREQQHVFLSMPGERHPGLPGIWHLKPNSLFGNAGNLTDSKVSQPLLIGLGRARLCIESQQESGQARLGRLQAGANGPPDSLLHVFW